MSEDIKIQIKSEYDGKGAQQAMRDEEELKRKGTSSLATPPPNINARPAPSKQEVTAERRETTARNKALIADAEEDLTRARARGAKPAEIGEMEAQLRERKLTARFMREQNLSEEEAIAKARNLVALQNEAKERDEQTKAMNKARAAYRKKTEEGGGGGDDSGTGGGGGGGGFFSGAMFRRLLGRGATGLALFAKQIFDDQVEAARGQQRIGAQSIEATNRTNRIGSIGGLRGEEEATADFHAQRAELEGLKDKRGTFQGQVGGYWDQFKNGLKDRFGVKSWFGLAPMETDGDRAERENEEKIKNKEVALAQAQKQAQQKYRNGLGGMELQAQRARAAGNLEEARSIDYKILATKRYNEVFEKSGDKGMAAESAKLAVAEKMREVAGNYARLVTARDGAADTARVASAYRDEKARAESSAAEAVKHLTSTVQANHSQTMSKAQQKNFSRA